MSVTQFPRALSDPVTPAQGGTGQTTYTKGDILVANSATVLNKLGVGSNGQVLTSNSAATNGVDWETNAGGDVAGPASSTDNAIARFDSTTGKLIQNSAAFVDDSGNVYAPNVAPGLLSTATAAGTTTLTVASKGIQVFTGATTQTIVLPVVTTLPQIGFGYWIINNSSGALTVNSSGANLVLTIAANSRAMVFCKLLTGTSAASWDYISFASGITNSAGANVVTKSDGTNLVASQITDNGTTVDIPIDAASGIFTAGPVSNQILVSGTDNDGGIFIGNFAGAGNVYVSVAPAGLSVGFNAGTESLAVDGGPGHSITFNAAGSIAFIAPVLNVGVLPTSDPASAGQLWNNLGVVMRSNG